MWIVAVIQKILHRGTVARRAEDSVADRLSLTLVGEGEPVLILCQRLYGHHIGVDPHLIGVVNQVKPKKIGGHGRARILPNVVRGLVNSRRVHAFDAIRHTINFAVGIKLYAATVVKEGR